MNVVQKEWEFPNTLSYRDSTEYIVVHHTAGNMGQSVESIWDMHVNIGDNGIAYNRVITEDGTTIQGRPDDAVSAAAYGINRKSINIVVVGYFHPDGSELAGEPTEAQIKSLKENLIDCKNLYPGAEIIGHRQVAEIMGGSSDYATACPGDTLYEILQRVKEEIANG